MVMQITGFSRYCAAVMLLVFLPALSASLIDFLDGLQITPVSRDKILVVSSDSGRVHVLSPRSREMDIARLAPLSTCVVDDDRLYTISSNQVAEVDITNFTSTIIFKASFQIAELGHTVGKLLIYTNLEKTGFGLIDFQKRRLVWTHSGEATAPIAIFTSGLIIVSSRDVANAWFGQSSSGPVLLEAVDLSTGQTLWRTSIAARCDRLEYATQLDGVLWYSCGDTLYKRFIKDGRLSKAFRVPGMALSQPVMLPDSLHMLVQITAGNVLKGFQTENRLFLVDEDGCRQAAVIGSFDFYSSTVIDGGRIVLNGGKQFQCVDVKSCRVLFRRAGRYKAAFGSVIFCIEHEDNLYVIRRYDVPSGRTDEFGRFAYREIF
jgi:outer membrane protein assembly factor BamB